MARIPLVVFASVVALLAQEPATTWVDSLTLDVEGRAFADVAAPFDRLPARAETLVRKPVWELSRNSAGIAIRFRTDAEKIQARWRVTSETLAMPHMPATGVSGVDLYVRLDSGAWRWAGSGRPKKRDSEATLISGLSVGMREYLLYLPLYNGTEKLEIGVPAGRKIEKAGPRPEPFRRPVVFYGTSITHGACASRPGMTHVAILGRDLDRPVVNLGFSGNGTLDLEMADLLAEIDAAVYVLDCLPNMNAKTVAERAAPFVRKLRALKPATPILLVEDRRAPTADLIPARSAFHRANAAALRTSYETLMREGVPALYYLGTEFLLGHDGEATVDDSHPTDLGFERQAAAFLEKLRDALAQDDAPTPLDPVPTARQLRWHALEFYAFVHFNMNTFSDLEWGKGVEDPNTFNPTALDCRQWAKVAREAGMKAIILTAKHHDGFCLWPSAHSAHTVRQSRWRDGRGDVVRELSDACREFELKFGVYISPWDRNHPAYGDSPRYNAVFRGQLTELLSHYGEVSEVWFDGACGEGPNGKKQVYDFPSFIDVVRRLQPNAVIFSDAGPDIRWVGNENGFADPTCWSTLRRDEFFPGCPNSAELTQGHEGGTHWVPAECDVSIRPGWYYHADQDAKVKSVEQLLDIYYRSVGQNGSLLLNLPVDRRGLVHENDAARLMELHQALATTFGRNLASGMAAQANNVRRKLERFGAGRITDGDPETYWAADDGVTRCELTLEAREATTFDRIQLMEAIALGQRVKSFGIDAWVDGAWTRIADGTTIGHKRIFRVPPVTTTKVRVVIGDARACPAIAEFSLFRSAGS